MENRLWRCLEGQQTGTKELVWFCSHLCLCPVARTASCSWWKLPRLLREGKWKKGFNFHKSSLMQVTCFSLYYLRLHLTLFNTRPVVFCFWQCIIFPRLATAPEIWCFWFVCLCKYTCFSSQITFIFPSLSFVRLPVWSFISPPPPLPFMPPLLTCSSSAPRLLCWLIFFHCCLLVVQCNRFKLTRSRHNFVWAAPLFIAS